jgi:hypothetical protein
MHRPRLDTSLELLVGRLRTLAEPAVLATIVATAGSTYRKSGARMLIESSGRMTGLLSGGCFERDLSEHARSVLSSGQAKVVEYDLRTADDLLYGIGAGCEGAMRVLVERVTPESPLLRRLLDTVDQLAYGRPATLGVIHSGPIETLGTHVLPSGEAILDEALASILAHQRSGDLTLSDGRGVYGEYLAPPPRILICGAGPDAVPLAHLLGGLGFAVTITDHRALYLDAPDWRGARKTLGPAGTLASRLELSAYHAAIVMSHHLASDEAYLGELAASPIPSVGLLGPRARRERLLSALGARAAGLRPRLRGPVGLDIGAVTPEAIALAIATEIHALVAGRPATLAGTCDEVP